MEYGTLATLDRTAFQINGNKFRLPQSDKNGSWYITGIATIKADLLSADRTTYIGHRTFADELHICNLGEGVLFNGRRAKYVFTTRQFIQSVMLEINPSTNMHLGMCHTVDHSGVPVEYVTWYTLKQSDVSHSMKQLLGQPGFR